LVSGGELHLDIIVAEDGLVVVGEGRDILVVLKPLLEGGLRTEEVPIV
jgi:hypothetical protein